VEETLRLVKAFQFVETHGEVCPANWTPDSPTVGSFPKAMGSQQRFPSLLCLQGVFINEAYLRARVQAEQMFLYFQIKPSPTASKEYFEKVHQ
jgi:hypothetical protein